MGTLTNILLIAIALLFVFVSHAIGWIKNKKVRRIVKVVWLVFLMLVLVMVVFQIISFFQQPELIIEYDGVVREPVRWVL